MSDALVATLKAGKFQEGIALFEGLSQPTAQDYRWAGVCHLYLGNLLEAQRLLMMAVARGEDKARLDLVSCLQHLGQFDEALNLIQKIKMSELSAKDMAYVLREEAIVAIQQSKIVHAAKLLDGAWQLAMHGDEEVQAVIAHSVALNAVNQGNVRKAISYLEIAEPYAVGNRKAYVLLAWADACTALGRFDEAEEIFSKVSGLINPDNILLNFRFNQYKSLLCLSKNLINEAKHLLIQSTVLARESQHPEEEFWTELYLSEVAMRQADNIAERRHIQRLKALATTELQQTFLQWREGSLLVRNGDLQGVQFLQKAHDFFKIHGYQREELSTLLYLAESHAAQPAEQAQALRAAADLHLSLGQQHDLSREMQALPGVRALLATPEFAYEQILLPQGLQDKALSSAALTKSAPPSQAAVYLHTLGRSELVLNQVPVGFRLKKTMEVVAFLLRYGPSTLNNMQEEMFADVPPARSKNYIHQVRLDLKRVPGLSIPYNARFHTYSVAMENLRLEWDAAQLERALKAQDNGALLTLPLNVADFLPESESEWAMREREQWQSLLYKVALQALETWAQAGNQDKVRQLAQRLVDIDPLQVEVQLWLLRALKATESPEAARLRAWESQQLFQRELGQVPPELLHWEEESEP